MTTVYIVIVAFLLILAVVDLFVGVSNDAVNFLNSGIGAKVTRWRTLLIMASLGVLAGSLMSAGMMDVARHGIMLPSNFSFADVMVVFLPVMVTDVIVLDRFNSMGLPTSTTVSLVFELFGAATFMAAMKIASTDGFTYGDLINTDKCLSVIIAIFRLRHCRSVAYATCLHFPKQQSRRRACRHFWWFGFYCPFIFYLS